MTIGIPGKWVASFQVNGGEIVPDSTSLEMFKIIEESGNKLPTFELVFKTHNAGVLSYLNEGNVLSAGIGVTDLSMSGLSLLPMSKNVSKMNTGELRIRCTGMLNAIGYMNDSNVQISPKQSGLDFIQSLASKYFSTDITAQGTDTMNWIQHGISDSAMVNQAWLHSDMGSSDFPMIGITSDGTFRAKGAQETLGSGSYQWNVTNSQLGGNCVPFDQDWEIQSDTGFTNYAQAYSQTSDIINIDQGIGSLFNSAVSSFLGQSSTLEQSGQVGTKLGGMKISTSNNHDQFHQAKANNTANLASASATTLTFNSSSFYCPAKVLDVLLFNEEVGGAGGSVQSISGLWIITKVVRTISGNKFNQGITAVRESLNDIQVSS